MFFRRRCQNLLPVFLLIGGILLSLFIMKKMKDLYDSNQKYHRMQSYKKYMEELSEFFATIVRSANKSSENLQRLNSALQQNIESRGSLDQLPPQEDLAR